MGMGLAIDSVGEPGVGRGDVVMLTDPILL